MRRTKRLSVLGALAALLFATSCESFLDPDPSDVITPENFYKTSSDAIAATNAVYESTKWSYWLGFWYISDIATDDIIAGPRFGADGHRMSDYIFDSGDWPMGDMWGSAYWNINRANTVLDRVPAITMDPALRDRLLNEARFLRANSYFNLVRSFGDVPLLEKVYLTRQDWANAAQTAGQLIASGRYTLLPNWRDCFKISTEIINSESIFEINYDGLLDPGAGSVHTLFSLPSGFPGGDAYGLMTVAPSLARLFAASDTRGLGGTFIKSGYVDALGDTAKWNDPDSTYGPAFIKYLDQTDFQNMHQRAWVRQSNNWIVLRYADVLLMYAEAVNEGGAPVAAMTAKQALNAVRTRAGIDTVPDLSTAAFRDSVWLERRREFLFEGQRWFDLSRWGVLNSAMLAKTTELATIAPGETTVHGASSNLLPIPQGERNKNPNLTQNPGWN